MSRTLRLILEYDGTCYAGWQVQPNGTAIQEVLESALGQLQRAPARVHSSGRTDAGVHARGMSVHFVTQSDLPLQAFREGLNRLLPADIAVREASEMPPGFHARFDACGKWYRYSLAVSPARTPLHARYAWQVRPPLDLVAMVEASGYFEGEHDFAAFRTSGCGAKTTRRTIHRCTVTQREQDVVTVDVMGSGFLRNMVRRMVGTLVAVGKERYSPGWVREQLQAGAAGVGGPTAPPQGLCLMEVWYPDRPCPEPLVFPYDEGQKIP